MIKFTIPGEPKAKARPRVTKSGHAYTPDKTIEFENWVKLCYQESCDEVFHDGEIMASIVCYFRIPESKSKKKQFDMESGIIRPTKKPDLDNLAKSVLDALNGLAYSDDSQIVGLEINKYYSLTPRTEVELTRRGEIN